MTPIDSLREGILGGDWQKVCDGFAGMTGQRLAPPPAAGSISIVIPDGFVVNLKRHIDELAARYTGEAVQAVESAVTGPAPDPHEQEVAPRPQAEDPDSVRARELRDRRSGLLPTADDLAQFRVQHGEPQGESDGRRAARALPMPGQPMKNTFVDDGTLAANEIVHSQAMLAKMKPHEARPDPGTVQVDCTKCGKTYRVSPAYAPVKLGDETSSYVCNGCTRGRQ